MSSTFNPSPTHGSRSRPVHAAFVALTLGGAGCAPVDDADPVAQNTQAVTANTGSSPGAVTTENNRFSGRYGEVMYVKRVLPSKVESCTGTVIAPYAVLTAHHCEVLSAGEPAFVTWWGDADLRVRAAWHSPYLYAAHTPTWWRTLNDQQRAAGGNQQDWPAQHDQMILFVPELTPEYLVAHGIRPASINPYGRASEFTAVGVGSTGGASRRYVAQRYVTATPNAIIGTSTRDGYLSTDHTTPDFGNTNGGDSGGPAFGAERMRWTTGAMLEGERYVVGTFQNGPEGDGVVASSPSSLAPLAYDPGIEMTANQRLTVRLNALWVQARADDADGDGVPFACDANPAASNPASDNRCPAPIGGPRGAAALSVPAGQLACRPGYVAVGLRGRSGDLIDQLAVQCRALSCYGPDMNPNCVGNSSTSYQYWTDHLGGDDGGEFSMSCPVGQVMVGVGATDNPTDGWVHSLAPRCSPYLNVVSGSPAVTELARAGNRYWGADATRDCGQNKVLTGFQALSRDARFVTGLQPICSSEFTSFRRYMGGHGGGDTVLRCPAGYHAVGTVQNAIGSGGINSFGLLCGPRNLNGSATPDAQLVVARGRYMHFVLGSEVPPMVEPFVGAHSAPGTLVRRCGTYLTGLTGRVNGVLERIDTIRCATGTYSPSYTSVAVNVGATSSGYSQVQSCAINKHVDALYIRSGWLTDGISLRCTD